jgi:hypothetical protein
VTPPSGVGLASNVQIPRLLPLHKPEKNWTFYWACMWVRNWRPVDTSLNIRTSSFTPTSVLSYSLRQGLQRRLLPSKLTNQTCIRISPFRVWHRFCYNYYYYCEGFTQGIAGQYPAANGRPGWRSRGTPKCDVMQQKKDWVFCAWWVPKIYNRYGTPLTRTCTDRGFVYSAKTKKKFSIICYMCERYTWRKARNVHKRQTHLLVREDVT